MKAQVVQEETSSAIDIIVRKFMDDDEEINHEFKDFCRYLQRELMAKFFVLGEPDFKISSDIKMIWFFWLYTS